MNKITLYLSHQGFGNWGLVRNEFIVSGYDGISSEYCAPALATIAGVFRAFIPSTSRVCFATFQECDVFGQTSGGVGCFGTAFSSFDKQGRREVSGPSYYRDVVRLNLCPRVGRVGHIWLHGLLCPSDIIETPEGNRFAPWALGVDRIIADSASAYRCPLFETAHFVSGGVIVPQSSALTTYYTDAHAVTRWRRRVQGDLRVCADILWPTLETMFGALERAQYWQNLQIRIYPVSVWEDLVAACSAGRAIRALVENASKAGQKPTDVEPVEPVLRFGPTWGEMVEAWKYAEQKGDIDLQKLLESFQPHNEGGDRYIGESECYHYVDLLIDILKKVSFTANADWYNPRAYRGQLSAQAAKRNEDIIELAF